MVLTLLSTSFDLFRMYYYWFMRLMEDMCHSGVRMAVALSLKSQAASRQYG
jgi:hypothetical protein